jgi:hypothetical protein
MSVASTMIAAIESALASAPIAVESIAMPDGEQVRYRKRSELIAELNYWRRQLLNEGGAVRTRITNMTRGET